MGAHMSQTSADQNWPPVCTLLQSGDGAQVVASALAWLSEHLELEHAAVIIRKGETLKVYGGPGDAVQTRRADELAALVSALGGEDAEVFPVVDATVQGLVVVRPGRPLSGADRTRLAELGRDLALALSCRALPPGQREALAERVGRLAERAEVFRASLHKLSHDVRSPLSAMLMQLDLIELSAGDELSEDLTKGIARLRSSAKQIAQIATERVDEAHAGAARRNNTPLASVLESAAREHSLALSCEVPASLNVQTDVEALSRLFVDLMEGAEGPLRVTSRVVDQDVSLNLEGCAPGNVDDLEAWHRAMYRAQALGYQLRATDEGEEGSGSATLVMPGALSGSEQ